MSINVENIIEWSKPHVLEGRRTIIKTPKVIISIVGGAKGLYGDFKTTFEVAVLNTEGQKFVTKILYPNQNDDVIAYMDVEEMVEFVNSLTTRGFQVL